MLGFVIIAVALTLPTSACSGDDLGATDSNGPVEGGGSSGDTDRIEEAAGLAVTARERWHG